jgi:prepilin-type N-terminal cleavage/methylation domain-containing protein
MKKRDTAFTLVELLVVLVVVGILAALLLTAVSKSKARAHTAVCTGNLRQWGVAISMFLIKFGRDRLFRRKTARSGTAGYTLHRRSSRNLTLATPSTLPQSFAAASGVKTLYH